MNLENLESWAQWGTRVILTLLQKNGRQTGEPPQKLSGLLASRTRDYVSGEVEGEVAFS